MRRYAFVFAALAAFFISSVPASSQPSISIGPGGVRVDDGRRGVDCDALRRACQMRDQLGERGEGNCRRYRETCR
jgi:hypothetical protein